ncbi:MAG: type II toxin-antitoxin system RelE/ParE family toxin [Caulobacteraceae bacterium]
MKVVLTPEAETGLEDIGDFIALDSPRRAISFIEELREAAMALAATPLAFPLVPGFERHAVRRRVHRDYLIFYRVREDRIEVLHIVHGARDFDALLFLDG